MSRRSARKNAFTLLFQMEFHDEYERVKEMFFMEQEEPVSEAEKSYITDAVEGTIAHEKEIDEIIDSCAKGWNTARMNRVDLAILRLAVYEMEYSKTAPLGVIINEAVELAKKFSSDEAPSFVNGILGKIAAK